MKTLFAILIMLAVSGCATAPTQLQIKSVADDQFSQVATVTGAELYVNPFGGTFRSWLIRSFIDKKTGNVTHQLYVDISYIGDWQYYYMAADDTAKTLDVTRIASHVGDCYGGCSLSETIGISLDDATLRTHQNSGYTLKISAKSGASLIIEISSEQIKLQLAAIDNYKNQKGFPLHTRTGDLP